MARRAAVVAGCASVAGAANATYGVVAVNASAPHGFTVTLSASPLPITSSSVAWATFNDTIASIGWATLEVHTAASGSGFTDAQLAYAAGYVEGAITQQREWEFVNNACAGQSFGNGLGKYLRDNADWVKGESANHPGDPFWWQAMLTYVQWDGLYAGYNDTAPADEQFDDLTFYAATLNGDLFDLDAAFNLNTRRPAGGVPVGMNSHCSALVKVVGDPAAPTELYAAHTTWGALESMTRIYKLYDFPWSASGVDGELVPVRSMSFSSYPATLYSNDDFYTTDANMTIFETTLDNNNASLWSYISYKTVLDWSRNMVANRLARDGPSWVNYFSTANSGTYNNMFMILDYKLFTPGQPLPDNTLWVLEQMPGPYIASGDRTSFLRDAGYWASYNVIFTPWLFILTGQDKLVKKYGDYFTYANTSRALIFDRLHSAVVDEPSLRALMRHNDYQNDPEATQGCNKGWRSATNAIAERGDLTDPSADCIDWVTFQDEAAIDCKYTTAALVGGGKLGAWAQSGPTYDQQTPFVWSTGPFADVPHAGLPDAWAFPWVLMEWDVPPSPPNGTA